LAELLRYKKHTWLIQCDMVIM